MQIDKHFFDAVVLMRDAQKEYYKTPPGTQAKNAALVYAKGAEKIVDDMIKKISDPQEKLF